MIINFRFIPWFRLEHNDFSGMGVFQKRYRSIVEAY